MALRLKVRRTRPRVYLSEDFIPELRRRTETTHSDEWAGLLIWARGIASGPREELTRPGRLPARARRLSLLYWLRQGRGEAVGRDFDSVSLALEIAPALANLKPTPVVVEALAQLYDSFRAVLPVKLARSLSKTLIRGAEELAEGAVRGAGVLDSARSEALPACLAAGLALYGEVEEAQELIGLAIHTARDLMGTLQFFMEEDGGFPLGWAGSIPHMGQVPKLFLLSRAGFGQEMPRDWGPWLSRYAEFLAAGLRRGLGPPGPPELERRRAAGGGSPAAAGQDFSFPDGGFPVPRGGRGGGSSTVPVSASATHRLARSADLWRALAFVAGATGSTVAQGLLSRMRPPGLQEEKLLFESRPLPGLNGDAKRSLPCPRFPLACFYRRAGIALLKGDPSGRRHIVIYCTPMRLTRGKTAGRPPGAVSLLSPSQVLEAALQGPSDRPGRTAFARTRREVNLPEFRRAEVVAYETLRGPDDAVCEWLEADLSPSFAGGVETALRTFVHLRGLPGWPHPVLVVRDRLLFAEEAEPVLVFKSRARPEVSPGLLRFFALPSEGGGAAGALVANLLPDRPRVWVEEVTREPGTWRVRVAPEGPAKAVEFCQVFVPLGEEAADGAPEDRGPAIGLSPAEGALSLELAGRGLLFFGPEAPGARAELVARSSLNGILALGLRPGAPARLEVAGCEPVEKETTPFGAVFFDTEVAAGTGLVVSGRAGT